MNNKEFAEKIVIRCNHCGNDTPHNLVVHNPTNFLFDILDEKELRERYNFLLYQCCTCSGVTLLGGFELEYGVVARDYPRLYPLGASILPPAHTLIKGNPIPSKILNIYEEIWPLRHKAPNAFAGQIRRAIEYICDDRGAIGKTLYDKINDLAQKNILPSVLLDMTSVLKDVGNIGSHASDSEVDLWDAELLDTLFRILIQYIYITPSQIERLRQRIKK